MPCGRSPRKPRVCQPASTRLPFTGAVAGGLPGSPHGLPQTPGLPCPPPGSLLGPVRGQVTTEHCFLPKKLVETLFMCACVRGGSLAPRRAAQGGVPADTAVGPQGTGPPRPHQGPAHSGPGTGTLPMWFSFVDMLPCGSLCNFPVSRERCRRERSGRCGVSTGVWGAVSGWAAGQ